MEFFSIHWIFTYKNGLVAVSNADMGVLMGKDCTKIVVYPRMSTIFSKIVRKHCLHACDFFHVWSHHSFGPKICWTNNFFWPKSFKTQNFCGPKISSDPWYFLEPNIYFWLGNFHWRWGIKPFQAKHLRLNSFCT